MELARFHKPISARGQDSWAAREMDDSVDTPLLVFPKKHASIVYPQGITLLFDDSVREFLSGKETYTFFRGYFDGFLVAWVNSLACRALAHFE